MCSNFELNAVPRDVMNAFDLDDTPPMGNKQQLRPTDLSLIIRIGKTAMMQPWGFAVDWSKQPMINARSETLTEKATFRGVLENRCIVPATAYFEWRKTDDGKKLKNRISVPEMEVFGMAGLTDGERFTIVTCAPSKTIAHIHNRMPVVLDPRAAERWISKGGYTDVQDVLKSYEGELRFEEETPPAPVQGDLFG